MYNSTFLRCALSLPYKDDASDLSEVAPQLAQNESRHALLQQEESAATGECIACIFTLYV